MALRPPGAGMPAAVSRFVGPKLTRCITFIVVIAVAPLAFAACGSSSSSSSSSAAGGSSSSTASAASSSSSASSGGSGTAAAAAVVAAHRGPSGAFVAPGPAVKATGLKGKSVWYIPIGAAIPVLLGEAGGIQQAATSLGMSYHTCDGKLLASNQATCINQAVNAGAAGIITDSFDPTTVSTALAAAKAKKVPVIVGNENGAQTALEQFMTVGGDPEQEPVAMDWIIQHSGGKAKILSTTVIGDKGTESAATAGTAELKKNCSGCTQTIVQTTAAQLQNIGSAVSSSLLQHKDVDYGFPQFDFLVPLFKQGLQSSGKKLTLVSTNGVLSQMQEVKAHGAQVADIGANRNYLGWSAMDRLVRMILGKPAPTKVTVPVRVFDATNIGSVKLNQADSLSGIWYGPTTYQAAFKKLWGLG